MFIMWYPQEGHDAMKLELFEHNQKAYEAAISMMAETGKAAIIHPTGTGKSLIAFKLAIEHPDASVYWLAPSNYIYHTQLENLQKLMSGSMELNLEVKGSTAAVKSALQEISQIDRIEENTEASKNIAKLKVISKENADIREQVFYALAEAKLPILLSNSMLPRSNLKFSFKINAFLISIFLLHL